MGVGPRDMGGIGIEVSFRPAVFVEVAYDRSRYGAMGPDQGSALFVQTRCEPVEIAGAEAIVPDILLARPDDLQGIGDLFGETNGLLDRVRLEPAPKSSSDEMIVQGHLLDRKSRDPGRVLLSHHRSLGSYPNVAAVRADLTGCS